MNELIAGTVLALIALCRLRLAYIDWKAKELLDNTSGVRHRAITWMLVYDEFLAFSYQAVFIIIVAVLWRFPETVAYHSSMLSVALAFLSALHGAGTLLRWFNRQEKKKVEKREA